MWVIKQNGHPDKAFCYVGRLPDGSDTIDLLRHYSKKTSNSEECFVLQQRINGVEIAIARYFNGKEWLGPICFSMEHKRYFNSDLGPNTDEMGTLMWYADDDDNKLFTTTLNRMKSYLTKINYRGQFDLNCIVNEDGAFPLEATSRFGCPQFQLQTEFHISPWSEFLKAIADCKNYSLKWRSGYGVVVLIATPPFPFSTLKDKEYLSSNGLKVHFRTKLNEDDSRHMHFEEISMKCYAQGNSEYYLCSDNGYAMHVSDFGETVEDARENVYRRICNIVIPKMFYRTDIGVRFLERDRALLESWGYLS